MQLLVIQLKIKIFHVGFMHVLAIVVEISMFKIFKILKCSYLQQINIFIPGQHEVSIDIQTVYTANTQTNFNITTQ